MSLASDLAPRVAAFSQPGVSVRQALGFSPAKPWVMEHTAFLACVEIWDCQDSEVVLG